jgi:radical SAM-linked protein
MASVPRTPDGPPPPPAVQRLRLRYAKRGRLRFSSHRDFQRAFERALRRAAVPMAYSAGFSPHPKVSYAGAAPTGTASEAEYLEIALAERCDPERLREALDGALPSGLDVLDVVGVPVHGAAGLSERLEVSDWEIVLPGVAQEEAAAAATAFLATASVEVSRLTKNGQRRFDARAAVLRLEPAAMPRLEPAARLPLEPTPRTGRERAAAAGSQPCAILRAVVRQVTPAVRPDDVLAGLRQIAGLEPPSATSVTRLAQGPYDEGSGTVSDPLAPDRDTAGA